MRLKQRIKAAYDPTVFDVANFRQAKGVILTDEDVLTTDQRWERETPLLVKLMRRLMLKESSLVLDFGCGVGRLALPLIGKTGCRVIGADISSSMRALAADYVKSERFAAVHPAMLDGGLFKSFDAAIAVWIIQHVMDLAGEIDRIADCLRPKGRLFLVNETSAGGRRLPIRRGNECVWMTDNKDVRKAIAKRFTLLTEGKLDPKVVGKPQSSRTFWAIYQKTL